MAGRLQENLPVSLLAVIEEAHTDIPEGETFIGISRWRSVATPTTWSPPGNALKKDRVFNDVSDAIA